MQAISFTTDTDTQNNYLNISHNNDKAELYSTPTLRQGNYFKIKGVCKYRDIPLLHPSIWMLNLVPLFQTWKTLPHT